MKIRFFLVSSLFMLFIVYAALSGTIKDDFEDGKIADFWDPSPQGYVGNYPLGGITDADEHDGMLYIKADGNQQKDLWLKEPISGDFEFVS